MSAIKVECTGCGNVVSAGNVLDAVQSDGSYTHDCGHVLNPKEVRRTFMDVSELMGWTKAKPRSRGLSGGMLDWLLALCEAGGRATAGDIAKTAMRMGSRTGAGGGDGAKTSWWGLSEKQGSHWVLTAKGRHFLAGALSVPKYCDSARGPFSGPDVSVFDVRKSKAEVAGVDTQRDRVSQLPSESVAYSSSVGRSFA
jgi:hypothetical protein